jgi:phosphinothricin acetyltransferase
VSWNVRRATVADAEAVQVLAGAAWRATYRELLREDTIEAFLAGPYGLDNVRRRIAEDEFLVAEGSVIVAFADAVPEADQLFLAAIYAHPDRRQEGAGTALLNALVERHPHLAIDAHVLDGNRAGEVFYERRGFEPVETIQGDLFGELVTERRWRRPAASLATPGPGAGVTIRDATPADAGRIAQIYNEGIEDRVATLETQLRTAEERQAWLGARSPRHPVLVADAGSGAVGWASLNPFNARTAYDLVGDFSVYVARDLRGRGVGDALLTALEARARTLGYHKLVLAALEQNAAGSRLYRKHGFDVVGIYREQGMLDGRWIDVIVMEKLLT